MAKREGPPPGTPGKKDDIRSYEGPGPRLRGLLMYDTSRGQHRVRKWPAKRPGERHPTSEFWSEWMSQGNRLYRYTPPEFQQRNIEATRGTMLMPRDMFFMAARGTLATIEHPDGRIQWPAWFFWRMSDALDAFGDIPGSVLVRMEEGWAALPPGVSGDFLTSRGPGTYPVWTPGGGGGIGIDAPLVSDFPTIRHPSQLSVADGETPGIVMTHLGGASPGQKPGIFRPIDDPPVTYTLGMIIHNPGETGRSSGLALRNSSTGAWYRYHLRDNGTFWGTEIRGDRWSDENDHQSTQVQSNINNSGILFLRLHLDTDGTITLSRGTQAFGMRPFNAINQATNGGPYDQFGLNFNATNSGNYQSIWCFQFTIEH